jgi:hypothetical protein
LRFALLKLFPCVRQFLARMAAVRFRFAELHALLDVASAAKVAQFRFGQWSDAREPGK